MKRIDLRSDTVTQPTDEMREAMFRAEVGDDIMGEDPTVQALEKRAAQLLGKEAALFLASGTMANQVAVMVYTNRGDEIIVGDTSHIFNLESGALAALCQVQTRVLTVPDGVYDVEAMESLIRTGGVQSPRTGLICIENTNNLNKGMVVPLANIQAVCNLGKKYNVPVYMDGARIFNAAVALGVPAAELVKDVDSVMFALTKGIGAPFGSILAGSREFIDKARWLKQRMGGGFRQIGFMAAPAIVGLDRMMEQIQLDHENGALLAQGISKISGLGVCLEQVHTNIISVNLQAIDTDLDSFLVALMQEGIMAKPVGPRTFRMVTHYGITDKDIGYVISVLQKLVNHFGLK